MTRTHSVDVSCSFVNSVPLLAKLEISQ